jgi:hypothetical protein
MYTCLKKASSQTFSASAGKWAAAQVPFRGVQSITLAMNERTNSWDNQQQIHKLRVKSHLRAFELGE